MRARLSWPGGRLTGHDRRDNLTGGGAQSLQVYKAQPLLTANSGAKDGARSVEWDSLGRQLLMWIVSGMWSLSVQNRGRRQ